MGSESDVPVVEFVLGCTGSFVYVVAEVLFTCWSEVYEDEVCAVSGYKTCIRVLGISVVQTIGRWD